MKHTIHRALALVLAAAMLVTCLVMLPLSAGAESVSIQNGTGSRGAVEADGTLGYRAIVNGSFDSFTYTMPTWNTEDSECTISLYRWDTTFSKTIAGEAIASQRFAPLVDNAKNTLSFDPQPAGEYLFLIHDTKGKVGVWSNSSPTDPKGFLYVGSDEMRGEPELTINFIEKPAEPFGNCESSVVGMKPTPIDVFSDADGSSGVQNIGESMAVRVNLTQTFIGVYFRIATYFATDIDIDYLVYKWEGSYDKTVAGKPAAKATVRLRDNATQGFRFDPLPAGEYLVVLANATGDPAMYMMDNQSDYKGIVYRHGYEQESRRDGMPQMQIVFDNEYASYFTVPSESEDVIDGNHTPPEEYVLPEDSKIYTHPVMPDTWVFTDALGRTSLTNADVGDLRDDKTLAIFYWTWHVGGSPTAQPVNNQKFREEHPDILRDYNDPAWPKNATYFWNQPIYGYYKTNDDWVLRRQAELLADAGVDVIFTDNTNGMSTWRESYLEVYKTWDQAMTDGVKTPKVSFMLPFWDAAYTSAQMQDLYLDIFRPGKYQNLWYYLDGKPMVMAHGEFINGSSSNTFKEIANFFTWRGNDPDYMETNTAYSHWGWLSMYPQAYYYRSAADKHEKKVEQVTVGVAMNHNYVLHMLSAMSGDNNAGRSYTSDLSHIGEENSKLYGYNLAEQFEYALSLDPSVIFVTGWNEWKAGRYEEWPEGTPTATPNAFPDQCDDENSRDIEPTWGDLKDNYFYELVNYVRRFKGARPIPTPSASATIDLSGAASQWDAVEPYFGAYIGNTGDRDAIGYGNERYTEYSGRNDIIGAKVARDDENVYFWVECNDNITPYTDPLWMVLYLDVDQSAQGWETFDYVINKTAASADKAVLERFTGSGYASEKVADVSYKVDGKTMTIVVPKSALGLSGNDYTINFAWTDNVHDVDDEAPDGESTFVYTKFSGDLLNFYVSGDVAPGGRFKFSYISTDANAKGEPENPETTPDTTPDTEPVTEDPATEPDTDPAATQPSDTTPESVGESETEANAGEGCKSSAASAAVLLAAAAAAALKKRKED